MSETSDDELTTAEAKPLSPLQIFFVKVAIITAAIIAVLYARAISSNPLSRARRNSLRS